MAMPGLIDSHVHITFGDYTPRQKTVGFLESYTHGGVTTCISASEVHVPGRPRDPAGVKALAIAARKSFETLSSGRHARSCRLDHPGTWSGPRPTSPSWRNTASGWRRPASAHSRRLTIMHLTSPWRSVTAWSRWCIPAARQFRARREFGPTTCSRCSRTCPITSMAGRSPCPTPIFRGWSMKAIWRCRSAPPAILRTTLLVAKLLEAAGQEERLLIATDTPTGSGVMPLGMLYTMSHLAVARRRRPGNRSGDGDRKQCQGLPAQ